MNLYIVNHFECPDETHLAEQRSDGKFYYVHPSLSGMKEYWGMTPSNPTPVWMFGVVIKRDGNTLLGKVTSQSAATYPDGRPRRWQGAKQFSFNINTNKK